MLLTYTDLSHLTSLEDRFRYLSLKGTVGESTFGFDRWMNQQFYRSSEWRSMRNYVISRDQGYDLGSEYFIKGHPIIHHMNPLTVQDIEDSTENLLDPEFLISTSLRTHNAIHFGDESLLPQPFVERRPGDTRLW